MLQRLQGRQRQEQLVFESHVACALRTFKHCKLAADACLVLGLALA